VIFLLQSSLQQHRVSLASCCCSLLSKQPYKLLLLLSMLKMLLWLLVAKELADPETKESIMVSRR